jgi:hypothetical protein
MRDQHYLHPDLMAPDDLFLQEVQENSNREMDWLWLATRVGRDAQRRYCLQRALAINPESHLAQRGLSCLQRHPGKPIEFA